METYLCNALPFSEPLVFIRPLSLDAKVAFGHRNNNHALDDAIPPGSDTPIVRIDYGMLLGRSCIKFGASRTCEVYLPGSAVNPTHFKIHIQPDSGLLLLTDVSTSGIWLSSPQSPADQELLQQSTQVLGDNVLIELGTKRRYQLLVSIPETKIGQDVRSQLLQAYLQSIGAPQTSALLSMRSPRYRMRIPKQKYVMLQELASGGFGTVSVCLRARDGLLFAAKTVRQTEPRSDHSKLARICHLNELSILSRMRHPNIVRFVEHVRISCSDVLVMELLPHGSLANLLDDAESVLLQVDTTKSIVRQCLHALKYINDHDLIHHDIKPQNILVRSKSPIHIKICDFGGARDAVSILSHNRKKLIGTKAYRAPEWSTRHHSFGVDVWAIGIILLNCQGYWPWRPTIQPQGKIILPDYSLLGCSNLLDGMLDEDRARRFKPVQCLNHPYLINDLQRKRKCLDEDPRPNKRLKTHHIEDPEGARKEMVQSSIMSQVLDGITSRARRWGLF